MKLFLLWCAAMSLVTFCLYGVDKRRAVRGMWRVPERVLLLLGLLGGAAGGLLGMRTFHHKTRHRLFWLVNGFALALQCLAAWWRV